MVNHLARTIIRSSALLLAILLSAIFASPASAQKTIAEYDHTDPAVRAEFFEYLDRLAFKADSRRYIDVAVDLVSQWQEPEQTDDLRRLCHGLFGMLISAQILDKYFDLTEGCPQDQRDLMAGKVDRDPIPVVFIAPKYSRKHLKPGVPEEIIVSYAISAEGKPENVRITSSSNKRFNRPILKAAKKARFLPAIRDQLPVLVPLYYVKYEVIFAPGNGISTLITEIGTSLHKENGEGCITAPWDEKRKVCK